MNALDLCCGKGGWSFGLMAAGYECWGVDVTAWEGYPGHFIHADVRTFDPKSLGVKFDLVVASPPCQEFSYRHLPFGRIKNLPPPNTSIWEACQRIAQELNAPLVIENVIGAVKWMGPAQGKFGPYYLWGDVPALLPTGKPTKSMCLDRYMFNGVRLDAKYQGPRRFGSKSKARKEWSATAAMIPIELGKYIGDVFASAEPSREGE